MNVDKIDKQLLTAVQRHFPLVERPFDQLGKQIGISEQETICRLERLKSEKYLRFIGAIINTASLGFKSLLVAFEVDPDKIESAAETVNKHPGVSHNYQREDRYNMWFTLALPQGMDLDETIGIMRDRARPRNVLVLPAIKTFKIGVVLDVPEDDDYDPLAREEARAVPETTPCEISPEAEKIIEALQTSIPLVPEPFAGLFGKLGMSGRDLLAVVEALLQKGIIRRFGAIPAHRKLGYQYNVMATWQAPEEKTDKIGKILASFKAITHAYARPTFPDWPYSLYSMIHCRSRGDSEIIIDQILRETGIEDYKLLRSVREFKKTRLKYFSDEFDLWQQQHSNLS